MTQLIRFIWVRDMRKPSGHQCRSQPTGDAHRSTQHRDLQHVQIAAGHSGLRNRQSIGFIQHLAQAHEGFFNLRYAGNSEVLAARILGEGREHGRRVRALAEYTDAYGENCDSAVVR